MKLVFKRGACSMAVASALILGGCGGGSTSTTPNDPNPPATPPTTTCSTAGLAAAAASTQKVVCMLTSKGELVLELRPDVAPLSSANFLKYVNDGYYNNTLVHRVDKATPLFQAPYFNVYGTGAICQGNVDVPTGGFAGSVADRIEAWNKAFFDSFFTHPNTQGPLVNYKGGPYRFWRDMLDGRHAVFPESALVPLGTSLAKVLDRRGPDGG